MSTCHCFTGTPGDRGYEPNGTVKTIHGLNVYQALAPAEVKGEILFLPDVFGLATHNKILADEYAKFGYNTTIVDYFQGEALPDIIMSYTPGTDVDSYSNFSPEEKEIILNTDMPTWLSRHSRAKVSGLLHPFFVAFREGLGQSAKLHVLGHCFGGKYALRLAKSNKITSAMTMHPSFIEEEDWQNLQRPVMVCCAESDVFTPSLIADTLKAAAECKVYYKISVYGGTVHGFASRADRSNSEQMRPYRSSFEDSLSWMKLVEGS
ncbi:Alpha/Beta hydrolase protein [Fusarium oxysporum]|nr:Alpha/Beta hydrolase protein [Fusarium oxysporum]